MFDTADLVGHIYRETVRSGYKGMPLHHIVRDEVQDFSQAELLLDMRYWLFQFLTQHQTLMLSSVQRSGVSLK